MRFVVAVLAVCLMPVLAADGVEREVVYIGTVHYADPVPTFDKGYLLFLHHHCEITAYGPNGKLAFTRSLTAPGERSCSAWSAAVDSDGTVAASIAYPAAAGYAGAILLLDPSGNQTSVIETGRYMPSHVCFDRRHAIWSIGWQSDQNRNESADEHDYMIVRKFSKGGRELGGFVPRSLWAGRGEPGKSSRIAAANDRIGAIVYRNYADHAAEWIEWDLEGKLLSRVPLPNYDDGGWAYTASGRLYWRVWEETAKKSIVQVHDPASGTWKPVRDYCSDHDECGLLMGADGEHLVYRDRAGGPMRLLWVEENTAGAQ